MSTGLPNLGQTYVWPTTIPLPSTSTATITGYPQDPQVRIAMALERIAAALEQANIRHTVTVTPAKPRRKVAKKR